MSLSFPNESAAYRTAREKLLTSEIELRALTAKVAEERRALPPGGLVKTAYDFTGLDGETCTMSGLFKHPNSILAVYSLMYRPDAEAPCPMCSSMLDGLNAQADHIGQRHDLVVVAAATPAMLSDLAATRGWDRLRLYSTGGSSYQRDYFAETGDGAQLPMLNIFTRSGDEIRHFWGSELFYADVEGQPRHVDTLWPLWNMFDFTPLGRGDDWHPALDYEPLAAE